jgi:uncharacterized alkaline shock family protein YloU
MEQMTIQILSPSGRIEIYSDVIAIIAGSAALQCYGLVGMASRKLKDGIAELLGRETLGKGIEIRQEGDQIHLDLYIVVAYGTKISEVALNVQRRVRYTLKEIVGIDIDTVTVFVQGVRVVNP